MATIPTADSIGLRSPTQTGGVVKAPKMELYQGKAAHVGAANLRKQQEKLDNEEISKAQVQYQLAQMSEIEKFEKDTNIDTSHETYATAIDEQLAKAGQNITNSAVRELFMEKGSVVAAESKLKVNEKQFGKVRDRERGYMSSAFAAIVDGAKNLEYGDPATAALALQMTADSMVERGIMTRQEAEKTISGANDDIALGRLKSMRPDQQLEILNSMEGDNAWAKRVPPETQKLLKTQAETELANTMAMDFAFTLAEQENPPDRYQASLQIYKQFKSAPDYLRDNLVANAQREYGNLMTNKKMADTQKTLAVYDNIDLKVRDPQSGMTLAQLNNKDGPYWEQWNEMDPAHRSNIESYMTAKASGRSIVTDRGVYMTIRQKFSAGPDQREDAIDYFMKNHGKLSDTDWKFWDKELIKGQPTGLFNHQTRLLAMTEKWNWQDQSALLDGLDRWYTGYQQTHQGAPPSDQEIGAQIRNSIQKKASGRTDFKLPGTDITFGWDTGAAYQYSKTNEELVDTFAEKLADTENPTGVQEFMENYDPQQQGDIKIGYMNRRDPELLQLILGDRRAKGLPLDIGAIEDDFEILYGAPPE